VTADRDLARYLPTFVDAAHERSFSAVARKRGLTPAAVSKAVRTLEHHLGARLFHRSTRSLSLTDDGEALLRDVAPMLEGIDAALASARSARRRPRGKLRVAAPYAFGKRWLVPVLATFRRRFPDVELDLLFGDQVVDLVEEQVDVAIGLRTEPGASIVARRLCESRVFTLAAPELLARLGEPETPRDLSRFPCLGLRTASGRQMPWPFVDPSGDRLSLTPPSVITVSSQELGCELAAEGLAITTCGWVGLPYVESGRLVPILEPFAWRPPPMMIYYPSRTNLPAKVRVFVDHLVENLEPPGA
jgi:DNA-binding transcriptional LysR family regulator